MGIYQSKSKRWYTGISSIILGAERVPSRASFVFSDPVLDHARGSIRALAYLVSVQVLESGPEGTVHVVVLTGEAVLACVTEWVELVAPVAAEVEPFCR